MKIRKFYFQIFLFAKNSTKTHKARSHAEDIDLDFRDNDDGEIEENGSIIHDSWPLDVTPPGQFFIDPSVV